MWRHEIHKKTQKSENDREKLRNLVKFLTQRNKRRINTYDSVKTKLERDDGVT